MKNSVALGAIITAIALVGCASPPLALERVGPAPRLARATPSEGHLLVQPAALPLTTLDDPDMSIRVDYKILSSDGALYRNIRCWGTEVWHHPTSVRLPAGLYTVEARATGYGRVRVPVVIEAVRTTTVCLNGQSDPRFDDSTAELVTLPNGAVVGWRARN